MRVSDYIAKRLKELGCQDVFMVTGGAAMHLNDSLSKIYINRTYFLHHEQSCAMAAEAYARIKNIPAIVNVTAGPGAINAVNGVFGAYVDSLPMIVISGQAKRETLVENSKVQGLRQLGDQEVDITEMVKKVCKKAVRIRNPQEIIDIVDDLYEEAISGRPGPVWIDVPIDVQAAPLEDINSKQVEIRRLKKRKKDNMNNVHGEKMSILAKKLLKAKRPILYIGNGIRLADSYNQLIEFLKMWPIATVTNWNSNDLLWDDHPCYSGRPGTVGNRAGNFAVQYSDCILTLGARLNIRQVSYNYASFGKKAWKCHVDIDQAELVKPTLKTDLTINADLKDFLPTLSEIMRKLIRENEKESADVKENWNKWIRFNKKNLVKYCPIKDALPPKEKGVNPYRLIQKFSEVQNENSVTVTSDGTACVVGFQAFKIKKGQRLFHNSGCASMGYELPAAIGSFIATRDKVFCIAGDGSIMMNLQELSYIGENRLPILILLINNNGYHSIRQTQANYFPDNQVGCSKESGLPFSSFEKLSKAFNIEHRLIVKEEEIEAIFEIAFKSNKPMIVEAIIDLEQEFAPKLSSRKKSDGSMESCELENMSPFLSEDEKISIYNEAMKIGR